MRAAALILLALAGCQTTAPKIVRVPVKVIVPVPAALTEPCDEVAVQGQTVEEAVRLANARLASLKACNGKLAEIRKLGQ